MRINPELKKPVIKKYIKENKGTYISLHIKEVIIELIVVIGCASLLIFEPANGIQGIVAKSGADVIYLVLITALDVIAVIGLNILKMSYDLQNTRYMLEKDCIVRITGKDTERYKYREISNLRKDGDVVSFDCGKDGTECIELLDFYQPPLYEELKKRI